MPLKSGDFRNKINYNDQHSTDIINKIPIGTKTSGNAIANARFLTMQKEHPTLTFLKKAIASRKKRGATSVEILARQSDIHPTTLYKHLAGKQVLNSEAFLRLLATLNLTDKELRELLEVNKVANNGNKN